MFHFLVIFLTMCLRQFILKPSFVTFFAEVLSTLFCLYRSLVKISLVSRLSLTLFFVLFFQVHGQKKTIIVSAIVLQGPQASDVKKIPAAQA